MRIADRRTVQRIVVESGLGLHSLVLAAQLNSCCISVMLIRYVKESKGYFNNMAKSYTETDHGASQGETKRINIAKND